MQAGEPQTAKVQPQSRKTRRSTVLPQALLERECLLGAAHGAAVAGAAHTPSALLLRSCQGRPGARTRMNSSFRNSARSGKLRTTRNNVVMMSMEL